MFIHVYFGAYITIYTHKSAHDLYEQSGVLPGSGLGGAFGLRAISTVEGSLCLSVYCVGCVVCMCYMWVDFVVLGEAHVYICVCVSGPCTVRVDVCVWHLLHINGNFKHVSNMFEHNMLCFRCTLDWTLPQQSFYLKKYIK